MFTRSRESEVSPEVRAAQNRWQQVQRNTLDAITESRYHGTMLLFEDKFVPRPVMPGAAIKLSSIYVPFVDVRGKSVRGGAELSSKAVDVFERNTPTANGRGLSSANAVGLRSPFDLPLRAKKLEGVELYLASYQRADFLSGTQQSIYDEATQTGPQLYLEPESFEQLSEHHQQTIVDLTHFVLEGARTVDVRKPFVDPDSYIMRPF